MQFHFFQDRRVVAWIAHYGDVSVILGSAPQHGRPTDVDLLNRLIQSDVRLGYRTLKRVEVNGDQIDRFNLVSRRLLLVNGIVSQKKQSTVYLGMERFNASA